MAPRKARKNKKTLKLSKLLSALWTSELDHIAKDRAEAKQYRAAATQSEKRADKRAAELAAFVKDESGDSIPDSVTVKQEGGVLTLSWEE